MKKHMKRIVSVVLACTMCLGMSLNVQATTTDKINAAENKADALNSQKDAVEAEKAALAKKLNSLIAEMEETQQKLSEKREEIRVAEDEIVKAKVAENDQYQKMKLRIKFSYERGDTTMLELLMDSDTIGDFLNKAEYITQVSDYDRKMLEEYQQIVDDRIKKEEQLQVEYEEISVLRESLVTQQENVQQMLSNAEMEIADLEKQIGDNAALLKDLIAQAEEEKRIQREQQQAAANMQNNSTASTPSGNTNSSVSNPGSSYTEPSTDNVVVGSGKFCNPCPGASYISSYFGYREWDDSFHKGIDYAAAAGTPTYAAAAGRVLIAGWSDSAGNWVVIDHGDGFVTKYMHHTALCVSAGDYVSQGQQVGTVGTTGYSSGNHLHFQVELDGTAVDPLNYL